jgi:hypothetical protein
MTTEEEKKFLVEHEDIKSALWGNPLSTNGGSKGVVQKTDEMYNILLGWAFVFSVVKWIGSAVAGLAAIAGVLWHFLMAKVK